MKHALCPQLTYFTFCKSFNTIIGLVFQFRQQEYWNKLSKQTHRQKSVCCAKMIVAISCILTLIIIIIFHYNCSNKDVTACAL